MNDNIMINVGNDFYDFSMRKLIKAIKEKHKVHIYVECIGKTKAEMVETKYEEALKKEFPQLKISNKNTFNKCYYI